MDISFIHDPTQFLRIPLWIKHATFFFKWRLALNGVSSSFNPLKNTCKVTHTGWDFKDDFKRNNYDKDKDKDKDNNNNNSNYCNNSNSNSNSNSNNSIIIMTITINTLSYVCLQNYAFL